MKIVKLNSILFSLMAIAMVTVFLTSCEKNPSITEKSGIESSNKDRVIDENQEVINLNSGKLQSKEIQIFDESLNSNITIKVSTAEKELLDLYTNEVFEVDFRATENENTTFSDVKDDNSNIDLLHDTSIEREKVFIEISELNLRSDMPFSVSINTDGNILLRAYNVEYWHLSGSWRQGMNVRCTGRGIDGLSAYGYDSPKGNCARKDIFKTPFDQRYFYNQNSSSKDFWNLDGFCMWVRIVGYNNNYKIIRF